MTNPIIKDFIDASVRNFGQDYYRLFSQSTIGIAGIGGLGSCVAGSLARAAIGKLVIADFDIVEMSNINRQQYFLHQIGKYKTEALTETLKQINPCLQIQSHRLKLTAENIPQTFADCEIICECFDLPDQKQMLVETVLNKMPEKIIVSASGMAGFGRSNDIVTKQINDRLYLIGDGVSAIGNGIGLYAARVAIAANHQANKVLELLSQNNFNKKPK